MGAPLPRRLFTVEEYHYARAGIPEVWLVDLDAGEIRVFREPASGRYRHATTVPRGGEIAPAALPEVVLAADEVLG